MRTRSVECKKRMERVIKLFKEGKSNKEIANELNLNIHTVCADIVRARKDGIINKRKIKREIKREQAIELYKQGKSKEEIAEEVELKVATIKIYVRKARREGTLEKEKTKLEEVKELYEQGKSDEEIAEELNIRRNTLKSYFSRARKKGLIKRENIVKEKNIRIKQVAQLYKEGKTKEEIAEELRLKISTVTVYIRKAIREGMIIENKQTGREQTIALYKEGKSKEEIAEKTGLKESTISGYISEAKRKGLIENKKTEYNEEQEKALRVKRIKQIPLYREILFISQNQKIKPEDVLYRMVNELQDTEKRIELAKIYFLLGNTKVPERILDEIIFNNNINMQVRVKAKEEKESIAKEALMIRMRKNPNEKLNNKEESIAKEDIDDYEY